MEKNNLRVLLIDDHDLVLQGLKSIIENSIPEVTSICTASSGAEALACIESMRFDVYMLDLELPDMHGLDLVDKIKEKDKCARIIVNTLHEEIWVIKNIMRHNVNGLLFKSIDSSKVVEAICRVLNGETYYCSEAERVCRMLRKHPGKSKCVLSPRELDVGDQISEGKNTQEIATELCVSVNTVETHRRHLLDKLGARNVADLVMTAVSEGIIPIRRKD